MHSAPPPAHVSPIAALSRPAAEAMLRHAGLPRPRPRNGVVAYRLGYQTSDPAGRPIRASALVVLPRTRARELRTVVYEHGTVVRRSDAPSAGLDSLASSAAVLYAARGFAVVAPDYLGLGEGAGEQAYMHAATEASASLDAVRAARRFAARHGRRLDPRLFVTGFSQGGHAAMALGRALQAQPDLQLAALAPVAGPFDLEHQELPRLLDGSLDARIGAYNLSALLLSWQRLYHVQPAFAPRYAGLVPRLFDGRHSDAAILSRLPDRLSALFTADGMAALRTPSGDLLRGMRENDTTCDWTPTAPVRLYAATGDRAVAFGNSLSCAATLRARGVAAPLVDLGGLDHFPSMFAATPRVLAWFALKPGRGHGEWQSAAPDRTFPPGGAARCGPCARSSRRCCPTTTSS